MSPSVSDATPLAPRRRLPGALWLLLAIAALVAALLGWKAWVEKPRTNRASADLSLEGLDERLLQAEARITALRRGHESLSQALTDTRARTGLLRDEVLAVTQRSSLLEDSVHDLSAGQHSGLVALRLDEAELLLTFAQQRLRLAGDVAGAIRASELAQGVLAAQPDPALLDLRQALAQEIAALRSAPPSPLATAAAQLDALESALPRLTAGGALGSAHGQAQDPGQSGFDRLLDSLVQVRRGGGQDLLSPADRGAGEAGLALEIALARSALVRGDEAGLHRSAGRIEAWLLRLYPDGATLRSQLSTVRGLRTLALSQPIPLAGSTLQQLHERQRSRREQQ